MNFAKNLLPPMKDGFHRKQRVILDEIVLFGHDGHDEMDRILPAGITPTFEHVSELQVHETVLDKTLPYSQLK